MADKIIPNLPKSEASTFDDLLLVVDTPSSAPTNKKITIANLFNKIPTTLGYGTEAVSTITVTTSTQALDGKALFLCTATSSAACVATMSAGDFVGQTITIMVVAVTTGTTQPTSFKITPSALAGHGGATPHTVVNLPSRGSSATLVWSGSTWVVTEIAGSGAVTAAS